MYSVSHPGEHDDVQLTNSHKDIFDSLVDSPSRLNSSKPGSPLLLLTGPVHNLVDLSGSPTQEPFSASVIVSSESPSMNSSHNGGDIGGELSLLSDHETISNSDGIHHPIPASSLIINDKNVSTLFEMFPKNDSQGVVNEYAISSIVYGTKLLSSTLLEVEKARSDLKKEVKTLKMLKSQLETELYEKRVEIDELNQTIEKKIEKEQARLEEANKDKALLVEMEAVKQMVKKENVSLKHRINELEHLMKLEKNSSKKKEEEIKRLESMKGNLETRLTQSNEEMFNQQKIIKELEVKLKSTDIQIGRIIDEKKEIEEQFVKLNTVLRSCLNLDNVTLNESEMAYDERIVKNRKSYLVSNLIDCELLDSEFVRSAIIDLLTKVESLSKERDDLKSAVEQGEQLISSVKETNRNLKVKVDKMEIDYRQLESDNKSLSKRIEELNGAHDKLEESLSKCNSEKKNLTSKVESLTNSNDKLEKEKRKLSHELTSIKSLKSLADKEAIELRERLETKIKKLEVTKESLDTRVSSLLKQCNQLTEEKESLQSELKMADAKIIELQNHNYKLHSALNEANLALKRSADGEKDLKKKVNNLTDSVEQQDAVSKDVSKQIRKLKDQIQELKSERSSLQNTIESDRHSLSQTQETVSQLLIKIKKLEVELNLSNLKRKEAEFQQTILTNSNIDKEAKIKDLKSEYEALEERFKQLLINQKCMEKSYSVSAINRRNNDKITEDVLRKRRISSGGGNDEGEGGGGRGEREGDCERTVDVILEASTFAEDTDITAKGLRALEEENIKLQKKVKSLQHLMNEASNVSVNANDLSNALREAQQKAENLLSNDSNQSIGDSGHPISNNQLSIATTPIVKRYSRSEIVTTNDNGASSSRAGGDVKITPSTSSTSIQAGGQTRYRTSSRTIQECTRTERTQITSTPISSTSVYRFQQHHQRANSPKSHN